MSLVRSSCDPIAMSVLERWEIESEQMRAEIESQPEVELAAMAQLEEVGEECHGNRRSTRWVFVASPSRCCLLEMSDESAGVKCMSYQTERGAGGLEHVQGMVVLTKPMTFRKVAVTVGVRLNSRGDRPGAGEQASFKVMKGSSLQNLAYTNCESYCRECHRGKGPQTIVACRVLRECVCGNSVEKGLVPGTSVAFGVFDDVTLADLPDAFGTGASNLIKVARTNPMLFARHQKAIEFFEREFAETPRPQPVVLWCCGGSGSGKSRFARSITSPHVQYWAGLNGKWFDGYNQEKSVVVFDDIGFDLNPKAILRLLDRYPVRVEVKGATRPFTPHLIVITNIDGPQQWWDNLCAAHKVRESSAQLLRRVSVTATFPKTTPEQELLRSTVRLAINRRMDAPQPAVEDWKPGNVVVPTDATEILMPVYEANSMANQESANSE